MYILPLHCKIILENPIVQYIRFKLTAYNTQGKIFHQFPWQAATMKIAPILPKLLGFSIASVVSEMGRNAHLSFKCHAQAELARKYWMDSQKQLDL